MGKMVETIRGRGRGSVQRSASGFRLASTADKREVVGARYSAAAAGGWRLAVAYFLSCLFRRMSKHQHLIQNQTKTQQGRRSSKR